MASWSIKAKEAVNNKTVLASLVKIKRDYSLLTTIIKKMESSKYSIVEAHSDINKLDFKKDSASVMPYIAKGMNKMLFGCEYHHGTLKVSS